MFSRLVERPTLGLLCLVSLMILIWPIRAPAQTQPQVDLSGKKVVILHEIEYNVPILVATNRALIEVLESGGISIRNQFYENLDFGRNPEPEHRKKVSELLRQRYSNRQVDLIITTYAGALKFALNEGRTIFPQAAPILALYLAPGMEISESNRVIIRHSTAVDPSSTLESALKLLPKTKQVYVVSGAHINDKRLENLVRQEFKKWEGRLEFFYLSNLPMEKILATVSSLPGNSIVLLPSLQTDVLGTIFTTREAVRRVSQASNAPVFGLVDVGLGYGLVGGYLISYELMGRKAGELGLEILRSGLQNAAAYPKSIEVRPIPMYDGRQLKRWGLSASTLPEGSTVINKELTLWNLKYYIIAAVAFFLLETALIIFLIVQRRRKNVAEESLRQRTEELDQFFNVSLDLLGIANTEGYFLRLNPAAETILGYPREELMAKRFLEFVHPDDLDRTREALSTLAFQQKVFSFENRYRCKDGTYRWLQWSSAPAGNLIYAAARDITERKRTEEILQEREEAARETAREASILAEIGRTVSSTLNIDQIYEAFAAEAQKIIAFDRIVISLFDVENGTFMNVYIAGEGVQDRATENVYPLQGSGNAEMLRTKSTVLLQAEDFREYKDRFPMLLATFEAGFRSIMNVPLFSKGKIIGGLLLRSRKPNAYADKDVRVAESVGNQIAGAVAIAQSFQEQKQMENSLRKSEERFRQVAETVGDFIWEVDANGLYRYTSPSVEKILGYTPGELIGKMHFYDLFAPEAREELKTTTFNVFATKQMFRDFPNPNISKEGKVVHLETSGVPVLDETGNLVGYRGADTDVTERKKSERALAESQAQILALFDSTNDFIWSVDPETFGLVTFNRGLRDYFFNRRGIKIRAGMTPDDLFPSSPEYAAQWREFYTRALREGSFMTEYFTAAGTNYLLLSINPMRRDGIVFGISVFGKDITEQKRAEEELWKYQEHLEELIRERTAELVVARDEAEGANRAKSTFLANMSHELRTPLNSILGIAQLMERDAGFPFQHRDTLKILSRSGAYLLELINDVLEMSKIEAGKTTLDATSFDPRSFLGDLEEMTRLRADQKGLKLFFEYKSDLPGCIETDVRKLRQILINLLSNAIKYTEKGRVTLRIAFKEGRGTPPEAKPGSAARLEFEVEDTGIGIAPEDRQRIFEPFVQVNPGRAAREGTGLGLTLSRMFVEQLGGEITIRSQAGRGSTFVFDIPVKLAEGITIHTEKAVRQVLGLMRGQPSYQLLVVDDSVENRFTLRRLLEQCGFIVLEACGGQEAVDLFESRQPHLIWMDLRMPGMDGHEAAQRIREVERGRRNEVGKETHTPIIALTAHVLGDKEPFSPGIFDDLVYKPYRETEIFDKLEKHLGVQFVYQPSVESSAADKDRGKGVTPSDLAVLPVEWLRQFFQMLRRGRSAQLIDLIGRISPEHADLAGTLAELVHIYRFDHLMVATEGALKEASNG
jgi:PAS domain S-box-containing protein